MRLNRSSKLLDELWDSSVNMVDRDLSAFDGMYRVEMATGIIPNLPNWRKYISNTEDMLPVDDNQVSGYNCYFRVGVFGDFGVRLYHYGKDGDDKLYLGLLLEYNNGLFKDYMRLIRSDLFLGRFYIVILGREVFMGYFWLYKAKEYRRDKGKLYKDDYFRSDLDTDDQGYGFGNEDINIMDDVDDIGEIYLDTIKIEPLTEKRKQELLEPEPILETDPDEIEVDLWEETVSAEEEVRISQEDGLEDGWVED